MYNLFMQTTFNFFALLAKLPKIIVFLVIIYILIKVIKAFFRDCFSYSEEPFLKNVYNFFDPYHQSVFSYKYGWVSIPLIIGLTYLLCKIYIPPELVEGEKGFYFPSNLFCNPITYFVNYIVHENLGHNMFCTFGQGWFCYFAGNFIETLVPCIIYLFSLQLRGGLFFSPILLFWISTTFYEAGIYASDAATSKLALTMSDMVSDAAAGTVKGDWYYTLTQFHILEQAEKIGWILEIIACIIFALAIYSIVEYFRCLSQTGIGENY